MPGCFVGDYFVTNFGSICVDSVLEADHDVHGRTLIPITSGKTSSSTGSREPIVPVRQPVLKAPTFSTGLLWNRYYRGLHVGCLGASRLETFGTGS